MKNRFEFYEIVIITTNNIEGIKELAGQRGTVLGMSQSEETERWCYAISLDSTSEVWHVEEEILKATGEAKKRSDLYSGESIKVKVNRETGEGSCG